MLDRVFRTLSRPPRRRVLCAVADHDGQINLNTLGEETIIDAHRWKEHKIALYHIHLPYLDDHGFIEWNRECRVVKEGEQFGGVRPFVEILNRDHDDETRDGPSSSLSILL